MTKWGGRAHWRYRGVFLGSDEHGDWIGYPVGTDYRRPGHGFVADFGCVGVVPSDAAAYLAAFYADDHHVAVYVDVTTPAVWDGTVLRAVDLDLDVIRRRDGTVYLDDEDEFAEHRVAYGYPPEVVAMAEESAAALLAAVRAGAPPYDGSADRWLELLDATALPRPSAPDGSAATP
jgi:hypothetical protein